MNANVSYLDGNAAGGELSRIFALDLTAAEGQGQCANCGAKGGFADTHLMWIALASLRAVQVVIVFCYGL
jgi:prepilin-type processing-associated H-X9-DG protein